MKKATHSKIKAPQKKTPPQHDIDAVIFDIDNVLVDTRRSYLDAIRWTLEIYLTDSKIPLFTRPAAQKTPSLLSAQDVDDFKLLGGFNDDWDCCYGLLVYILTLPVKKRTLPHLREMMNIQSFIQKVKQRPLGVSGIIRLLGRPQSIMIEKIARIFQEVYLGKDLFLITRGKRAVYWKKRGLIHKERLIFNKQILRHLKTLGIHLGIATGRPLYEAQFVLKHFGILDLFEVITSVDDVKKAEQTAKQSLRKPHPFSLLETAKKMAGQKHFLYVGDLPDDILAANQAKPSIQIRSVAFPAMAFDSHSTLKEIQKMKPDFVIQKPRELVRIIEKKL